VQRSHRLHAHACDCLLSLFSLTHDGALVWRAAGIDPDANGLAGIWGKVREHGEAIGIPVDCCYSTYARYVNRWLVKEGESFGTLKAELKKFMKGRGWPCRH